MYKILLTLPDGPIELIVTDIQSDDKKAKLKLHHDSYFSPDGINSEYVGLEKKWAIFNSLKSAEKSGLLKIQMSGKDLLYDDMWVIVNPNMIVGIE